MRHTLLWVGLYVLDNGTRVRDDVCWDVNTNMTFMSACWVRRVQSVLRERLLHDRAYSAPKTPHTTPVHIGITFAGK